MKNNRDTIEVVYLEKGTYVHNKSGKKYELIDIALHSETEEQLVVYKPLYECKYSMFVRPYSMFVELVELNGEKVLRFEKIDDEKTIDAKWIVK